MSKKKSNKKAKQRKALIAREKKAQGVSRLLTILILGVIGFTVYNDVKAEDSRYLTDDELLELNDMDDYLDELEAKYPTEKKQITVCWSESQQRLVPEYMGCE